MEKKNKRLLILTLFTSLFSVVVGGVSTFAWFQIDQKPIQSEIITGSPNITISDNIYGYKINQTIGNNGYLSSSNDILKFGKDNNVTGTNHHQDTSDTNFNVPNDGIGYYLVKRNPSGSFKYNYTADGTNYTSYSWKFTEYQCSEAGTYMSRAFIDNFDVKEGDVFRVMHYSFANSKTIHDQLLIKSVYPTEILEIDEKTTDVKYKGSDEETFEEGTYKIWLDYVNLDLSFESTAISSGGFAVRSQDLNFESDNVKNGIRKRTTSTESNSAYTKLIIDNSPCDWKYYTLMLQGSWTYSTGYDFNSLKYFVQQIYTTNTNNFDAQSTTKCYKIDSSNEKIYLGPYSFSNSKCTFYLPSWLTACNVVLRNGTDNDNVNMNYLNNLYNTAGRNGKNNGSYVKTAVGKTTTITGYYANEYYGINGTIYFSTSTPSTNIENFTWTTNTVTISHVNTSGTVINSNTSSSNTINVNNTQVPSSSLSLSRYNYAGVYYSRTNSFNDKTSTSLGTYLQVQNGLTIYLVYNKIYDVNVYASLFINNNQSFTIRAINNQSQTINSSTIIEGQTFTVPTLASTVDYNDETNAIHYTFSRQNSSVLYKTAACDKTQSNTWTNGSTINADTDIYAKYNCTFTNKYTTFYIDINDANTNRADGSNQWSSACIMYENGGNKVIDAVQVASNLFRVTLPNDYTFRIGNGYTEHDGAGNNFSTIIKNYKDEGGADNLPASHVGEILYIKTSAYGSNHDYYWCTQKSESSYGTATIYTSQTDSSNPSDWTPEVTMDIGDGQNNYFIYEKGLQIPTNTYIHVIVDGGDGSVPVEPDYGLSAKLYNPEEPYLNHDGTYVKTCNYTGNARFTFYLTHSQKLVVAMVPDYGNGFYIMNYNKTYGTDNYIGSIKMTSNSDSRASYEYFYATAGEEIFIRSYLNGVDRLIDTSWTLPRDGVYLGTDGTNVTAPGVIHFTNKGYYNITVENGVIEVTALSELSSSFKLNKLDTSNVDSAYKIWKQKTSLVLEVPFTAVNDYESQISLTVNNPLSEFVGVTLCVVPGFSSSKSYAIGDYTVYNGQLYKFTSAHSAGSWNASHVTEVSPYNFMRGEGTAYTRSDYYNHLSNSSTITDQMNSRIKSQNNTDYSYAYILVDYLPTQVNAAGYAYSGQALEGNSAYSGSVCASGIYSNTKFTSTLLRSTISYYLVATQV